MRPTVALLTLVTLAAVASGQSEPRLPPCPLPSESEAEAFAVKLRDLYAKPPGEWPAPTLDPGVPHRELGLLPAVQHPAANPHTPEKAKLGEALFFDPRLSGTGQMACASCHDPDLGWADGRTTSFGHGRRPLKRNAPTVRNSGYLKHLFWDGRADSLEAQIQAVFDNPHEMRSDGAATAARLQAAPGYAKAFEAAFPGRPVGPETIAEAIACYERSLVGGRSRFDQFLKGKRDILTDSELRGLHLFRTDARCLNCHGGPTLSDGEFHNIGLSYYGREFEDLGRYARTQDPADVGKFKTPSLRDVGRTAPYMHNGLFELDGVLNAYNAGMPTLKRGTKFADDPLFPTKSPRLKSLGLNKRDLADLQAFLRTLDEPTRRVRPPDLALPESDSP